MRSLYNGEVAQGVERAVLSGAPGSALLLHPELSFYWPDTGLAMFNIYCIAARMLLQVRYHSPTLTRPSIYPTLRPFVSHIYSKHFFPIQLITEQLSTFPVL